MPLVPSTAASSRRFSLVPWMVLGLAACTNPSDPELLALGLDLPTQSYDYETSQAPGGAAALDNTPNNNPITNAGATLGRVLFFDPLLSANEAVACGDCHIGSAGFSDDVAFSEGFDGGLTGRKSMPLVNVRYYRSGRMFWDERADTLEDQVLMPIQDPVEMGLTLTELQTRVDDAPYYGLLFTEAFGDETVTTERISQSLAQFVRSMESFASPYDQGLDAAGDPGDTFPSFTAQENRGKAIFFGQGMPGPGGLCASCHFAGGGPGGGPGGGGGAFFSMPEARVNGMVDPVDGGIGDLTGDPQDIGRFKSPSLRNVALRGPFMHDGRFATLAEVVDFYDAGIQDVPNLDNRLRGPNGEPIRLGLSADDKAALVAFLETLTDLEPAQDVRFSDPFLE